MTRCDIPIGPTGPAGPVGRGDRYVTTFMATIQCGDIDPDAVLSVGVEQGLAYLPGQHVYVVSEDACNRFYGTVGSYDTGVLTIVDVYNQSDDFVYDVAMKYNVTIHYTSEPGYCGPRHCDKGATGPRGTSGTGATGPRGPSGHTGATGPRGPSGHTGATGPRGNCGEAGPTGNCGEAGPTGPRGLAGESGLIGERGEAGSTGPRGLVGEAGSTGPRGLVGEAGPTGERGEAGQCGEAGPTGPRGLDGEVGPTGPRGEAGPTGPRGLAGEVGPTGPRGLDGEVGSTGPRGLAGEVGSTGPKGLDGEVGPTGPGGDHSGLVFIKSIPFELQDTTIATFDNIFSDKYMNYILVIENEKIENAEYLYETDLVLRCNGENVASCNNYFNYKMYFNSRNGPQTKSFESDIFSSVIPNHMSKYSQCDKIEVFSPYNEDYITAVRCESISQGINLYDGMAMMHGYFNVEQKCDGVALKWNTNKRKGRVKVYGYL